MVSNGEGASHVNEIIQLAQVEEKFIFRGKEFTSAKSKEILKELDLDYIIGIHFPYYFDNEVLSVPKYGVINLHPAYLPYNKGWHTPSWAIIDKTKIGGTLHFMSDTIDSGNIIHQKELSILPDDTANTLYKRVKKCELDTFVEAWEQIKGKNIHDYPQAVQGTSHQKSDLFNTDVQRIDKDKFYKAGDLIDILRALTTSDLSESAYFEEHGKKYRIQISIYEES